MQGKTPRKLTIKETKLIELKAKGLTHAEAYPQAYNPKTKNKHSLEVMASETLNKPIVRHALDEMLLKKNITIDRALTPIAKGLDATKQNEYTGEITEDLNMQLKASDRALKLLGVSSESPQLHLHQHLFDMRSKYDI